MMMTCRIGRRRKSEGFELGLNPLQEDHGFLEGFGKLLLILGEHLAVGLHELIQSWIFTETP